MKDYIYIRAWGKMMGSNSTYTERVIDRARREGAPQTAIYLSANDGWRTYEQITNPETKRIIDQLVGQI
jgi:hypothetical protein